LVTLREAISAANGDTSTDTGQTGSGADVITFDLGAGAHVINLAGALPDLSTDLTIAGPADNPLTVRRDAGGDYRIFNVSDFAARVAVSGLTIANGHDDFQAGGIFNAGTLELTNDTLSDNSALFGGGIVNQGQLTITGCTITGSNADFGGGILNQGQLSLINSTLSGNTARFGGAILNQGAMDIASSTIARNTATFDVVPGGGGVYSDFGSNTARDSIFALNSGDDFSVSFLATADLSNHNFMGGDPLLAPLGDNGGPTPTMALLSASPCIDAGDPDFAPPPQYDQRGAPRVFDGRIDIGAFEFNTGPTTTGIPGLTATEDAPASHVNLRDSFNDDQDRAAGLVYTVVGDTNPALFSSVSIDDPTDVLTLGYAHNQNGTARITIRATDTTGLFVDSTFTVTVLSAAQQAQILGQQVLNLTTLNKGNVNSLFVKLALKGTSGDLDKVQSFIASVQGFAAGGKINTDDALSLLTEADALLTSLG
jgi:hypothetical protein